MENQTKAAFAAAGILWAGAYLNGGTVILLTALIVTYAAACLLMTDLIKKVLKNTSPFLIFAFVCLLILGAVVLISLKRPVDAGRISPSLILLTACPGAVIMLGFDIYFAVTNRK